MAKGASNNKFFSYIQNFWKEYTAKFKKNWKRQSLILFIQLTVFGAAFGFLFLLMVYMGVFGALPDVRELKTIKHDSATEIYSRDSKLMGKYYVENRSTIKNNQISKNVKNALVATEDSRFFQHKGFDVISLMRVIFRSIILMDRSQGGGSTISQQLAKNLYPREGDGIFSLMVSKAKEIFIASRIEDIYSKDDVLTLYLNTVPFGEDVYGIESAAERFFSKDSKDLNPSEAATLIGMLAANTAYNPRLNPEKSLKRRNTVLSRMGQANFLTPAEVEKYQKAPTKLAYSFQNRNTGIAPYFREKLRVRINAILKDKYGDKYDLSRDGLKVYTTIDSRMQAYADEAVKKQMQVLQKEFNEQWKSSNPWSGDESAYVRAYRNSARYKQLKKAGLSTKQIRKEMETKVDMRLYSPWGETNIEMSPADSIKRTLKTVQAGFLAVDPRSGDILAWVGGPNHKYFPYDHVTAKRQCGSTFKPIVYAAALKSGIEPCDYFANEKRVYSEYQDWSPGNFSDDYGGFYSLKGALTNSVNTVTAELAVTVGMDEVVDLAHKMGVESDIPELPSVALGTAEISLLEMVKVYSTFANYGVPTDLDGLIKITDKNGKVLYQRPKKEEYANVLNDEVSPLIIEMMRGVIDNGTGRSLRGVYGIKAELAGKTGTTQNYADGWFIGYTPTLVAGSWVGCDEPTIHWRNGSLGQGAHTALPIFGNFLASVERNSALNYYTTRPFELLSEDLSEKITCEDWLPENPNKGGFMRKIFGSPKPSGNSADETAKKPNKKQNEEDRKSILDKMQELFR